MDPEVERRYQLIEQRAAAAEARSNAEFAKWKLRSDAQEAKWNRYMDRVDARLDLAAARGEKAEARLEKAEGRLEKAEARLEKDEARMAKYDIKFEATRKLVEGGMKIVMRNHADIKTLTKRMDDFVRAFRNGRGNGNGHRSKHKPS